MKVSKIVDKIYLILLVVMCACSGTKDGDNFSYDLIPVKVDEKWGYIDMNGKYVINPQFKDAGLFADGMAVVQAADGKYGYIGTDGKYVIQPVYKDASNFSEGLAFVTKEDSYPMCIDKNGKTKFSLNDASAAFSFQNGVAIVEVNNKYGLIDKDGKTVLNPEYSIIYPFKDGLACCCKADGNQIMNAKWGFIDKDGKPVINLQFKGAWSFSEGLACVGLGEKYGYIDKKGKYVINPQFNLAMSFSEGMAAIEQGGKWGYIDKSGKIIVKPQFELAGVFSNGLARVKTAENEWGYINKEGKYAINPQFEKASDFYGKFALVVNGGKVGLINKEGKYIVNPQFDESFLGGTDNVFRNVSPHLSAESDFFDGREFCESFFEESNSEQFKGLSNESTLRDVVNNCVLKEYLKPTSYFTLVLDYGTYEPGDVKVERVSYFFSDRIYDDGEYIGEEGPFNINAGLGSVRYKFRFVEGGKSDKKGKVLAKAMSDKIKKLYGATETDPLGAERDLMIRALDSMSFNTLFEDGRYIFLYTPTKRFSISYNDAAVELSVNLKR